jgi:hypothetical protein
MAINLLLSSTTNSSLFSTVFTGLGTTIDRTGTHNSNNMNKAIFGVLWLGFVVYAFFLAPPNQPDTTSLILQLSTGQWQGINPLIIALFNLMGIWPLLYTSLMLIDGQGQKLPAWPFAMGSFAVGAFAILPYLLLRQSNPSFSGHKNWILRLWDSRWTGGIALFGGAILITYGLIQGDWADFLAQWRSDRFIHVMSLDFCLLSLLFPVLLRDDFARRGLKNPQLFWLVSLLPIIGGATYLLARPPLPSPETVPG